jgi:hypothetical protein
MILNLKQEKEESKKQESSLKTTLDSEKTKQKTEISAKDLEISCFLFSCEIHSLFLI